jgi:hypothetical protein
MARTKTASYSSDDWGKILAVVGALGAFGLLPKKWGTPIAVATLPVAFRG